ncbi:MAG: ABC transporter ATP-binding protein [Candidatus Omnitrophica bacterium]|nr:ABC transporter ATP-binding protein [Candidatus Omnitrophota bacterium]
MIKTVGLCKHFGKKKAVQNLNLEIKKGEFFTFLGPNAAGKTTTIKMLTGLLKPTSGCAYVKDKDIQKDFLEAKKIIGYIPDTPFLYDKLTPREFVELVGTLYGLERGYLLEAAQDYFDFFSLNEVADILIENLSHGLQQRIVYIAALIHRPEVIFIDEPLVGLDPHSIHLIKRLLKKRTSQGTTIFMSTHILSIAEELADRIGIIDKGEMIAQGTFDELTKTSGVSGKLEDIFLKLTKALDDESEFSNFKDKI